MGAGRAAAPLPPSARGRVRDGLAGGRARGERGAAGCVISLGAAEPGGSRAARPSAGGGGPRGAPGLRPREAFQRWLPAVSGRAAAAGRKSPFRHLSGFESRGRQFGISRVELVKL